MRFRRFALSACLVLLFWTTLPAQDDEAVYWYGTYREALQEARRTGKPIFLEYRCEP